MAVRGIRGAITVSVNTKKEIIDKTGELLQVILERNKMIVEDIASAFFTVTDDLNAEFPAVAARNLGWIYTPLMCSKEIPVPGSLNMCVRVLLHINSNKKQSEMMHVYLGGAMKLRPDLDFESKDKYYISNK